VCVDCGHDKMGRFRSDLWVTGLSVFFVGVALCFLVF